MSTPVARYTVIVDRYLTDDCDGTGVYHDGTGPAAVAQLSRELQEGWDAAGIAGHYRIIQRHVYDNDSNLYLPHGYAYRDFNPDGFYQDDPQRG